MTEYAESISNRETEVSEELQGIIDLMLANQKEASELRDELHGINDQITDISKMLRTLTDRKNKIDEILRRQKHAEWQLKRDKEAKERELQLEQRKAELVREFKSKSARLDELTSGAVWRKGTKHGYKAKDYQIIGGKRLAVAQRAILGDKRGLGKTITGGVIYLDMVKAVKVLLIAPNDVIEQFEDELREWAPHRRIFPLSGMPPEQRKMMYPMIRMMDGFVCTINYEAWRRDKTIVDQLVDIGFDTVICDEAHRAKSSTKITARGIFQIVHAKNRCPSCATVGAIHNGQWVTKDGIEDADPFDTKFCATCGQELESSVKNVLPMTGTPILNKPQEMFSLLYMCYPAIFPSEKKYLQDYCYQYAPNKWRFTPGGEKRLVEKLKEFFVQRSRDDISEIDVPPPAIIHHELDFDPIGYPEQFRAYQELNNAAALVLEQGQGKTYLQNSILNIITRSRQIQSWPAGIQLRDPDPESPDYGKVICNFDVKECQKLDKVEELCLELMEEGERFIVWSQFKDPLYELERRLNSKKNGWKPVICVTGDTDKNYRTGVIYPDFDLKKADKNHYAFSGLLATYKAVGTGLNLNAARQCIILDQEWNPGMEDQAIGRIDRMNSQDQATVHIFEVKKTIDTFMKNLIEEKRKLTGDFESVVVTATDLLNAIRDGEM